MDQPSAHAPVWHDAWGLGLDQVKTGSWELKPGSSTWFARAYPLVLSALVPWLSFSRKLWAAAGLRLKPSHVSMMCLQRTILTDDFSSAHPKFWGSLKVYIPLLVNGVNYCCLPILCLWYQPLCEISIVWKGTDRHWSSIHWLTPQMVDRS